jgi:hypothetical protein
MNRTAWEKPLHDYLDETEANPPPEYVYTPEEAHRAGYKAAAKDWREDSAELARHAHARGYVEGVADTVGAVRWAAFRAQAYGFDLWTALGL